MMHASGLFLDIQIKFVLETEIEMILPNPKFATLKISFCQLKVSHQVFINDLFKFTTLHLSIPFNIIFSNSNNFHICYSRSSPTN